MKHKKSVLKILSANSECFSVSAGIAPNAGIFGRNGAKWEILLEALATVAFIVIQGAS